MLPMLRNRFATPTLFESTFEPWSDLRREIDRLFDSVMSGMRPIGLDDARRARPRSRSRRPSARASASGGSLASAPTPATSSRSAVTRATTCS